MQNLCVRLLRSSNPISKGKQMKLYVRWTLFVTKALPYMRESFSTTCYGDTPSDHLTFSVLPTSMKQL